MREAVTRRGLLGIDLDLEILSDLGIVTPGGGFDLFDLSLSISVLLLDTSPYPIECLRLIQSQCLLNFTP